MNGWIRASSSPIWVTWWAEIGYISTTVRWCIDFPITRPTHWAHTNTSTYNYRQVVCKYSLAFLAFFLLVKQNTKLRISWQQAKLIVNPCVPCFLCMQLPLSRYGVVLWLLLFFCVTTSFIVFWAAKPNCINVFSSGWKKENNRNKSHEYLFATCYAVKLKWNK